MEIYNLEDVVTPSQLRSSIASQIRKNAHITNPKVIDMLLFKGMEELNNVVEHAKQRHHIIGQYVVGNLGLVQDLGTKDEGNSDFLKNFYKSNYFWTNLTNESVSYVVPFLILGIEFPNKDELKPISVSCIIVGPQNLCFLV